MKHLNDRTIQRYIDNELPESERKAIASHLEKCLSCKQEVESQRAFADQLKKSFDTLVPDDITVSEFNFRRTTNPEVNVARIAIISSLGLYLNEPSSTLLKESMYSMYSSLFLKRGL